MSYRGLVTSKISPELFVFMKTKTYVCDINQSLVIMKSMLFTLLLVVLSLQMMAKTNGSTSPVDLKVCLMISSRNRSLKIFPLELKFQALNSWFLVLKLL